jgi:hypothetical protein
MKTRTIFRLVLLTSCVALGCVSLQAGPVTSWHTFRAGATTLSGQGTASPVFGSTNLPANQGFLVGYFNPLSLTNLGDRISFSFQLTFTDAAGMANGGDNFRFALYDLNGQSQVVADNTATAGVDGQTDNWRGYWFGLRNGSGTGSGGSIRERPAALTSATENPFSNTAADPAPSLGTVGGASLSALQSGTGPAGGTTYTGVMALEKTSEGVALAGYFFGGGGGTNIFAANDNSLPFPVNYSAVAYLNGNGINCDQINFQNVSVDYIFSNALAFVTQPVSTTVNVGQSVQFSASWTGSGVIPFIQWRENGIDIPDATNATYAIASANIGQSNNTYSVVVSNVFGNAITSTNATLTVNNDTTAPTVLSVSSLTSNALNVIFSEPVDSVTAQDSSSYSLSGNSFSSIVQASETNIVLTVDNIITTNYTLVVQNVKDTPGNTMVTTNKLGIAHGYQDSLGIGIANGLGFALDDKIVMYGGGLNIFGNSDQFQFTYKPMSGNFDISVHVESLLNTDQNARAGLMARLNTFSDSRNVLIEATPGRFIFQYRTNTTEATFTVPSPRPPTAFPNCWLRLVRIGSVFTGLSSTNNVTWDLIASHDTADSAEGAYPSDVLVGLAVSSANVGLITRAQFSEFGTTAIVPPPPTLSVAPAGNNVEVSWSLASVGVTLQATPSLTPSVTWTNVLGSSTTNRVFVPAGGNALFFRAVYP